MSTSLNRPGGPHPPGTGVVDVDSRAGRRHPGPRTHHHLPTGGGIAAVRFPPGGEPRSSEAALSCQLGPPPPQAPTVKPDTAPRRLKRRGPGKTPGWKTALNALLVVALLRRPHHPQLTNDHRPAHRKSDSPVEDRARRASEGDRRDGVPVPEPFRTFLGDEADRADVCLAVR
ncbi:MAG: hypothetical protein JWN52_2769 [Actinomycetia bacterium]|nr:hypothetical protein [Actinomycetes bacterium]